MIDSDDTDDFRSWHDLQQGVPRADTYIHSSDWVWSRLAFSHFVHRVCSFTTCTLDSIKVCNYTPLYSLNCMDNEAYVISRARRPAPRLFNDVICMKLPPRSRELVSLTKKNAPPSAIKSKRF